MGHVVTFVDLKNTFAYRVDGRLKQYGSMKDPARPWRKMSPRASHMQPWRQQRGRTRLAARSNRLARPHDTQWFGANHTWAHVDTAHLKARWGHLGTLPAAPVPPPSPPIAEKPSRWSGMLRDARLTGCSMKGNAFKDTQTASDAVC